MGRGTLVAGTIAAIVLIVALERSPSDDGGQVTLAAILVTSAALGALAGRRGWIPGALLGSVVGVVHLVALAAGLPEPGVSLPPGLAGALSLFVLVLPATAAGWAGSQVRQLMLAGRGAGT